MDHWIGLAKFSARKNIINISAEDGFHIKITLKENEKFRYDKIDDGLELKCNSILIKSKGDNCKSKSVRGFPTFISNMGMLIKKYIIGKNISNSHLDEFYTDIFKYIKEKL